MYKNIKAKLFKRITFLLMVFNREGVAAFIRPSMSPNVCSHAFEYNKY